MLYSPKPTTFARLPASATPKIAAHGPTKATRRKDANPRHRIGRTMGPFQKKIGIAMQAAKSKGISRKNRLKGTVRAPETRPMSPIENAILCFMIAVRWPTRSPLNSTAFLCLASNGAPPATRKFNGFVWAMRKGGPPA